MKLARLIIKSTQPDADERSRQREIYSTDPAMLIALGQTVAIEFATIAAATEFWSMKMARHAFLKEDLAHG